MGRRVAQVSIESRVRRARCAAGLSQQQLAARVGVSRQAIVAIEANQYVPNTAVALRLAQALGCRVEDLFSLGDSFPAGVVRIVGADVGARRAVVVRVRGRWIAHPLSAGRALQQGFVGADGLIEGGSPREQNTRFIEAPERLERTALLLGCDPSLGALAAHVAAQHAEARLRWLPAASETALAAIRDGEAHVAGSHLPDASTGGYNVSQARAAFAGGGGIVVAYARWEHGLIVARGNPKAIRSVEDLVCPDVRIMNRELGAGSRALLDELLQRAHIPSSAVAGYDQIGSSHLAVAYAVAHGACDAGITLRAVAESLDLDFVPLTEARFDLCIPSDHLDHPAVALLLDVLQSRRLRAEVGAVAGYDVAQMGTTLATIPRAA
jgi:putative molybdopterin biosynthesis protein